MKKNGNKAVIDDGTKLAEEDGGVCPCPVSAAAKAKTNAPSARRPSSQAGTTAAAPQPRPPPDLQPQRPAAPPQQPPSLLAPPHGPAVALPSAINFEVLACLLNWQKEDESTGATGASAASASSPGRSASAFPTGLGGSVRPVVSRAALPCYAQQPRPSHAFPHLFPAFAGPSRAPAHPAPAHAWGTAWRDTQRPAAAPASAASAYAYAHPQPQPSSGAHASCGPRPASASEEPPAKRPKRCQEPAAAPLSYPVAQSLPAPALEAEAEACASGLEDAAVCDALLEELGSGDMDMDMDMDQDLGRDLDLEACAADAEVRVWLQPPAEAQQGKADSPQPEDPATPQAACSSPSWPEPQPAVCAAPAAASSGPAWPQPVQPQPLSSGASRPGGCTPGQWGSYGFGAVWVPCPSLAVLKADRHLCEGEGDWQAMLARL
ncbi:hypothetical protein HYH03_002986 [Edaphochlamys debaryana]|uniref:Uncharacterized protein n=1 Tax=Edaphochlamys debaryana TaxID=47281 RepID=A0A835YAM5_9CHLO|nr:hypothetical protein HYH03_002986 [Edaphochlamys debaryana]|eukprot:KAG2499412.1 hypothetical protein HYH03_002986 [Edaphochlamys debaryana]